MEAESEGLEPQLPKLVLALRLALEPVLPLAQAQVAPEQARQQVDSAARALLPAALKAVRIVRQHYQQQRTAKTSCNRR
ncbi:MAG: hypothetical protein FWD64_01785 [Acidobacteriaceae bacterium]|nr:hypothetical protein [Acidobacteriaceae bacterium]